MKYKVNDLSLAKKKIESVCALRFSTLRSKKKHDATNVGLLVVLGPDTAELKKDFLNSLHYTKENINNEVSTFSHVIFRDTKHKKYSEEKYSKLKKGSGVEVNYNVKNLSLKGKSIAPITYTANIAHADAIVVCLSEDDMESEQLCNDVKNLRGNEDIPVLGVSYRNVKHLDYGIPIVTTVSNGMEDLKEHVMELMLEHLEMEREMDEEIDHSAFL